MEITLYRHAEPVASNKEKIYGHDFSQWIKRYNDSGIIVLSWMVFKKGA
jgi:hypothetical protein